MCDKYSNGRLWVEPGVATKTDPSKKHRAKIFFTADSRLQHLNSLTVDVTKHLHEFKSWLYHEDRKVWEMLSQEARRRDSTVALKLWAVLQEAHLDVRYCELVKLDKGEIMALVFELRTTDLEDLKCIYFDGEFMYLDVIKDKGPRPAVRSEPLAVGRQPTVAKPQGLQSAPTDVQDASVTTPTKMDAADPEDVEGADHGKVQGPSQEPAEPSYAMQVPLTLWAAKVKNTFLEFEESCGEFPDQDSYSKGCLLRSKSYGDFESLRGEER